MKLIKRKKSIEKKNTTVRKKIVFSFILGALIFGTIGVGAATLLYSKDITYDNTASGLSSTNLQDALDELYEQASSCPACDSDGNCTVTCPSGTVLTLTSSTVYKCIKGLSTTDLTKNVVTSGSGLYADGTESGRYIYRGTSPNNYITFNGESAGWRIISVESDGTIKIMKTASLGSRTWDDASARSATYCNYSTNYGCNAWGSSSTMLNASGTVVTSMPREYGGTAYALPTAEATLNTYLNGTYYNSLTSTAQSQIESHNFNVGLLAYNSGQTIATDVTQEKTYKWKGKIALANASDYVRASTNINCTGVYAMDANSSCYDNSSSYNWMFNSATWWTLSPISDSRSDYLWIVRGGGNIHGDSASGIWFKADVHPVVFLSSNITLAGNGTESDPYTIN